MKLSKKVINASSFFHRPILLCCFTILFPIPADKIALGVDDEVLDVRHNARDAQTPLSLSLLTANSDTSTT